MADIRTDPTTGRKILRAPALKLEKPKVDYKFESGGLGAEVFYQMEGMEALIANIALLPPFYQDICGFESANWCADVIADARDNYVPYKNGALRDSAGSDEYVPGKGIKITELGMWFAGPPALGFGSTGRQVGKSTRGAEAAQMGLHEIDPRLYAVEQHEDASFKHPILGPVTAPQYKYLEKPFLKAIPDLQPRLQKAVADAGGSL